MKTKTIKITDLKPAAYNPRKELKPGDKEYEALKNSLGRFGLAVPLIVNKKTGTLISGHQRLNVMLEMGIEEAEVVLVDMDEDREKLLNMSLNKIEGDWDYEKLKELFENISGDDILFTGFTSDELDNLFNNEVIYAEEDWREPKQKEKSQEFTVYLSFPEKEAAVDWLQERGIEREFERENRNVNIVMKGVNYG